MSAQISTNGSECRSQASILRTTLAGREIVASLGLAKPTVHARDGMFQIYPLDSDDDEGIYPAVDFHFDEASHPLHGPATLISRVDRATVLIYKQDGLFADINSGGLTTTTDPKYLSY